MNPRRARRLSGLLAAAWLVASDAAMATSAPSWMQALPGVPVPAHDDKADAVKLYAETIFTVQANGRIKRLDRVAYRILRPEGEARGELRRDYDDQSRITALRAWCIPQQGRMYEVRERDAIDAGLPGIENGYLMTDLRSRLIKIPAAVPGSIIGYEVEQEEHPYMLADEWGFQDTVPVREARYTLQLPPGWSYKATWLNHAGVPATTAGDGQWRWVVSDVPAVRVEQAMPPWRGIAARLVIALIPPGGKSQGLVSWRDVGNWEAELARGRRDPTPEIRQSVAALTGAEPGMLGKMRALARFAQTDIRYVGIELGIGGYQPHAAADVFTHRYGDCKDKVTLLSSMLKEIGLDSYYVVVNTTRGTINADTPPTLEFNHVILAIRLPPGLQDPTLLATLEHPQLGRLLFFDPTDPLTPLGRLSGPLQANYALLVAPDGGELTRLPQLPVETNSIQRTATLALDESGTLRGDIREVRVGDPAAWQRAHLKSVAQETDRIKPVEALVADSLSSFRIIKASVANIDVLDKPFEWRYTLEAEHYARTAGDLLLVRPRILGSKSSGLLETREPRVHPVEFDGPEKDTDVFEIELPAGYVVDELPPPVDADYGFASYHSKSAVVGRTLHYARALEIRQLSVPASQAEDLRQFYRIIAGDERGMAVLKRAPSP